MSALARIEQGLHAWWPDLRQQARDPWWIIGSAAAALLGADVEIADIDLLTSTRDAETLAGAWASRRIEVGARADDDRFRSRFGRYAFEPLPLEVMGDLQIHAGDGWQPLRIERTCGVTLAGTVLPVPALQDQLDLLRRFNRAKDQARIAALSMLENTPSC